MFLSLISHSISITLSAPLNEIGQHIEKSIKISKGVEMSKVSAKKLCEVKNLHGGNSQISASLEEKLLAECIYIIRHQRIFVVGRQTGNRVS